MGSRAEPAPANHGHRSHGVPRSVVALGLALLLVAVGCSGSATTATGFEPDAATAPPSPVFEPTTVVDPDPGEAPTVPAAAATPASYDDFSVQFQDDVLVGWFYSSSTPALTTPSGVAVGISEPDLTVAYGGLSSIDDTLGREFFFEVPAGSMAGFISEINATVTALYAGTNCFFR